ncbi:unnamed protein product [Orchesella dallaii]|uniref:Uncharacterized protein n=1 Tax=Orchesella dallaii TaxID=48710 RepID=A0ABP1RZQ3_9HEXA
MERIIALVLVISSLAGYSLSCNKGYVQTGWGQVEPVIIIPKPQLFPKLKQAFHEGKLLVDYHKIVGPSLKPLPYKKGVGFIGLGKQEGWGYVSLV